jgi:hypothetical protein
MSEPTTIDKPQEAVASDSLFSVFDECLNRHPFLLIEIGYNRVTDWKVTIWNARGVGIKDAPMVVSTSSHDREEAMAEAAQELRELFLSENDNSPAAGGAHS